MGVRYKTRRYKGVKFLYRFFMYDLLCVVEVIRWDTEQKALTTCCPTKRKQKRNELFKRLS